MGLTTKASNCVRATEAPTVGGQERRRTEAPADPVGKALTHHPRDREPDERQGLTPGPGRQSQRTAVTRDWGEGSCVPSAHTLPTPNPQPWQFSPRNVKHLPTTGDPAHRRVDRGRRR